MAKSPRSDVPVGIGELRAGANKAANILKSLGLLQYREPTPNYDSDVVQRARRATSYADEWTLYNTSSSFDLRLNDNSLLRFLRQPEDNTVLSYFFQECPYDVLDYDAFILRELGIKDSKRNFWDEYNDYVASSELKTHVVPLRYDWSPSLYLRGAHPSGHVHVGRGNDIRIGCAHILEPLAFVYFVLRQRYPIAWTTLLRRNPKPKAAHARGKAVPPELYKDEDFIELYLK